MEYYAKIERDDACFVCTFPDLLGGVEFGFDLESTLRDARSCLSLVLGHYIENKLELPPATFRSPYLIRPDVRMFIAYSRPLKKKLAARRLRRRGKN